VERNRIVLKKVGKFLRWKVVEVWVENGGKIGWEMEEI
jgi:hypothetical protein